MECKTEKLTSNTPQDGNFFKKRSDFEKQKLIDLAEIAERYLEFDKTIPDDCQGMLRSAAGKAKLLVNEKFKQFEDLIDKNLNPKSDNLSVNEGDLAGFWDLVMIEVDSLYKTFANLAKMSRDSWKNAIYDAEGDKITQGVSKPTRKSLRRISRS